MAAGVVRLSVLLAVARTWISSCECPVFRPVTCKSLTLRVEALNSVQLYQSHPLIAGYIRGSPFPRFWHLLSNIPRTLDCIEGDQEPSSILVEWRRGGLPALCGELEGTILSVKCWQHFVLSPL
jgi:hypothetical protein